MDNIQGISKFSTNGIYPQTQSWRTSTADLSIFSYNCSRYAGTGQPWACSNHKQYYFLPLPCSCGPTHLQQAANWCRCCKFTVNLSSTIKTFFIPAIISWYNLLTVTSPNQWSLQWLCHLGHFKNWLIDWLITNELMHFRCLYLLATLHRVSYFRLQLSHFLVDFYNSCTNENRNEYSTITCNLLT